MIELSHDALARTGSALLHSPRCAPLSDILKSTSDLEETISEFTTPEEGREHDSRTIQHPDDDIRLTRS